MLDIAKLAEEKARLEERARKIETFITLHAELAADFGAAPIAVEAQVTISDVQEPQPEPPFEPEQHPVAAESAVQRTEAPPKKTRRPRAPRGDMGAAHMALSDILRDGPKDIKSIKGALEMKGVKADYVRQYLSKWVKSGVVTRLGNGNYILPEKKGSSLPFEFPPARGDLDHYWVSDGIECGCNTCVEWVNRRERVRDAESRVQEHRHNCPCDDCRAFRKAQRVFMAQTNRRELWIESSWHAAEKPTEFGQPFMDFMQREIGNGQRTENWWCQEGGRYPLGYWFARFRNAVRTGTFVVTGAIQRALLISGAYQPV